MKITCTLIIILFIPLSIFGQLKAKILHDSIGTVEEYGYKCDIELASGNMLYFNVRNPFLQVTKTDQNFHLIESHAQIVGEFVVYHKARIIGDNIYLLGETGGYQSGGVVITLCDTNGFMIRTAVFNDVIPFYNDYHSLDIFPIASNYFGLVTTNNGLLEVLKVPSDLQMGVVAGVNLYPPGFPQSYYNIYDLHAPGNGQGFTFVSSSMPDTVELHIMTFDYTNEFETYHNLYWKSNDDDGVPFMGPSYTAPISSYLLYGEMGGTIFFKNKMFGFYQGNAQMSTWTGEILSSNYTILNVDRDSSGSVLNAYNANDSLIYLGYVNSPDTATHMYKNPVINHSYIKNGIIRGTHDHYWGETWVERFPVQEINTCREFKESLPVVVTFDPIYYGHDSVATVFRLANTYDYYPVVPLYTNIIYTCDPNHLSMNEKGIIQLSIFPNPATDFIQIETEEKLEKISILDLSGKMVKSVLNVSNTMDVQDVKNGMYILKIESKNGIATEKIIINR